MFSARVTSHANKFQTRFTLQFRFCWPPHCPIPCWGLKKQIKYPDNRVVLVEKTNDEMHESLKGQLHYALKKYFAYVRSWIIIFTYYVILPHWHDAGSWNPTSSKRKTYLFYIVNIMGADVLATQGARASATMIFTVLNRINWVPAHKG